MGDYASTWLRHLCNYYGWFARFNWLESYSNFIQFYCTYVNFKYGDEHSRYCAISSTVKTGGA